MHLEAARSYPVPFEAAAQRVLAVPLEDWLDRRFAAVPAVRATTGESGPWGSSVGQTRWLETADGGRLRETLVALDLPRSFRYELTDITGPMSFLTDQVEGRFQLAAVGTGTRVTWSWDLAAGTPLALPVLPVFGAMWRGMARRALERLEPLLLR